MATRAGPVFIARAPLNASINFCAVISLHHGKLTRGPPINGAPLVAVPRSTAITSPTIIGKITTSWHAQMPSAASGTFFGDFL